MASTWPSLLPFLFGDGFHLKIKLESKSGFSISIWQEGGRKMIKVESIYPLLESKLTKSEIISK
uniref:Uncharacterized protein n=1 Tax=Neobacillus citreus TaxID=2833578 RepID=A0A942TAW3_9BACI